MLRPTDMIISLDSIGNKMLLVDIAPKFEYLNGQRTGTVIAYSYTVVLVDRGYERLSVRIDGDKPLVEVGDDGYKEVTFDNLELYIYWLRGDYAVGARATGIHIVKSPNKG